MILLWENSLMWPRRNQDWKVKGQEGQLVSVFWICFLQLCKQNKIHFCFAWGRFRLFWILTKCPDQELCLCYSEHRCVNQWIIWLWPRFTAYVSVWITECFVHCFSTHFDLFVFFNIYEFVELDVYWHLHMCWSQFTLFPSAKKFRYDRARLLSRPADTYLIQWIFGLRLKFAPLWFGGSVIESVTLLGPTVTCSSSVHQVAAWMFGW